MAGWMMDGGSAYGVSEADAARADRAMARRMAGLPAGWPEPRSITIDVPDERRAIRIRRAA